jgi:hypothetical protein
MYDNTKKIKKKTYPRRPPLTREVGTAHLSLVKKFPSRESSKGRNDRCLGQQG